ncbi:MAG: AAC(3) family N-acetyltransferase [Candidatus Gorgyraea atricola]|nr:AAC(3) family N-acetyltransferase [Candidatus Gorgyraea atricola]
MKALYYYDSMSITREGIEDAFKKSGLRNGDVVMVHSDVGRFGRLGDIHNRENFLDSILDAFLNVLGKKGTLIVPTFTYSFCNNKVFDVRNTPSTVGIFTEHVRRKNRAVRSAEPIFSCAGIGRHAKKLLEKVGNECFGEDSLFDRLHKIDGKLMLFGRPFDITYTHYVEKAFGVKYRFDKIFSGMIINGSGKSYFSEFCYFARYLDRNVNYKMEYLGNELFKRGLLKKVGLGHSSILLCRAKDVFNVGIEMLKNNKYAFLANIQDRINDVKNN